MQTRSRRSVVLTVAGAFFLLLLDSTILNTSLPQVASSMGVDTLALSPTITGYLLASVAAMPLSAWLGQRFGTRRVYLFSIGVFVLASAACGGSMTLWQLVAARIVQGAAGGLMLTVGRTLAIRDAQKGELLSITSLLIWPALLAPVVGPPLGGWITTVFSWRWNFLLNVPLGLLGMLLIARFVPPDGKGGDAPMDWRGASFAVGGLAVLFGGLELLARAPGRSGAALGTALAVVASGAVLLALAVRHLLRVPGPVISLAPLRVRTFALATFAAGTWASMSLHATPYLLPLMFQLVFGASAATAGAMLLPYFLGNLLMKTATTPVLRRFGFKPVLLVDGLLAMTLIALCGLLGKETPWVLMTGLLFAAGAARSMLLTAQNTLCFADIDGPDRAAAATLSSISMLLAQSLGIVGSTLMLAGAKASRGADSLEGADFGLAFVGIALVGIPGVLHFMRLAQDDGHEVTGAARR